MVNSQQNTENKPGEAKGGFKLPLGEILSFVKNIFASAQNYIGIDLGSSTIKIAQLQKGAKGYTITNYITRGLPRNLKDNPEEKKRLVKEFVKEFVAESRVKTSLGRLAVWGKGVFIFSFNVPALNKKDLRGAVSMELKKRLPFQASLESIVFDFFVTGQTRDEKGLSLSQVTCIACDKILLEEQVQFLKDIGIRPIAVNTVADAIGNLVSFCAEIPAGKTAAVLDIGANISTLNFYKAGALLFSREIPIAGEHFSQAMAKTIPTAQGAITISPEDAEKIKRQCGIPLEEEAKNEFLTDFGMLTGEQISSMLRPLLERLLMELNRTFSYYASNFKSPLTNIEGLYLTGGSSRLKNLKEFLQHNLKEVKKIGHLNVLKAARSWKETSIFKHELVMEQAAPHLGCAFGLALAKGGKVNLLPAKEKLEQNISFLNSLFKIAFPFIFTLSLLYFVLDSAENRRYKKLILETQGQIKQLEPHSRRAREYLELKTKLEQRKKLLENASGRQPFWFGIFKELSNITPKEVILRRVSIAEEKSPAAIRLEGKIYSKYTTVDLELSQYIMNLEDSPFFSNIQFSSVPDMYSPVPAADFEITCVLSY